MLAILIYFFVTILTGIIVSNTGTINGVANGAGTIVLYGVIIFVAFAFMAGAVGSNEPSRIIGRATRNALLDILLTVARVLAWVIRSIGRGIYLFFVRLLPWFYRHVVLRIYNFFNTVALRRITGWLHRPLAVFLTALIVIIII